MTQSYENYQTPLAVVEDSSLTKDEKISILTAWVLDEHNNVVATEEGMEGAESKTNLSKILQALQLLDAGNPLENNIPTK